LSSLLSLALLWHAVRTRISRNAEKQHTLRVRTKKNHLLIEQLGKAHTKSFEEGDAERMATVYGEFNKEVVTSEVIDLEKARLKYLEEEAASLTTLYRVCLPILLSTMLLGFSLWYLRSQRYQDDASVYSLEEQKAKAELARLNLDEAREGKVPPASSGETRARSTTPSHEGTPRPPDTLEPSPSPHPATPSGGVTPAAPPSTPSPSRE
jgi:hypothetical protein